jgi:hypothetical protein
MYSGAVQPPNEKLRRARYAETSHEVLIASNHGRLFAGEAHGEPIGIQSDRLRPRGKILRRKFWRYGE